MPASIVPPHAAVWRRQRLPCSSGRSRTSRSHTNPGIVDKDQLANRVPAGGIDRRISDNGCLLRHGHTSVETGLSRLLPGELVPLSLPPCGPHNRDVKLPIGADDLPEAGLRAPEGHGTNPYRGLDDDTAKTDQCERRFTQMLLC